MASLLGRNELPGMGEVAALRPATRVLLAGFSGCIVLVFLVTVAAMVSVQMSTLSLPEWLGASSSASRGAAARSPTTFENIVQRPLFSRSRQGMTPASAPVAAAAPTPSTLDPDIALKGVFISGPLAKAFLLSSQNPMGVWVQVDEEIAGWKVVAVQPDQVILQGQGEKRTVQLHAGGAK
jgi:type II secretory pathway component PulC